MAFFSLTITQNAFYRGAVTVKKHKPFKHYTQIRFNALNTFIFTESFHRKTQNNTIHAKQIRGTVQSSTGVSD